MIAVTNPLVGTRVYYASDGFCDATFVPSAGILAAIVIILANLPFDLRFAMIYYRI